MTSRATFWTKTTSVYDQTRNLFYTTDPNGFSQFALTDLTSGAFSGKGAVPGLLGDMAYHATDDLIYGVTNAGPNPNVLYSFYSDGVAPVSTNEIGAVIRVRFWAWLLLLPKSPPRPPSPP